MKEENIVDRKGETRGASRRETIGRWLKWKRRGEEVRERENVRNRRKAEESLSY